MSLRWWTSPECVGLFALRRASLLGIASGYTSNIFVLNKQHVEEWYEYSNGCWPLSAYPLALCIYYTRNTCTPVCRDMIQITAAYSCIHRYDCKTRDRGTLYTLDNEFYVNRQSIGSHSNRRPIVVCDRYRLTHFEACCGGQQVSIDTFNDLLFSQYRIDM